MTEAKARKKWCPLSRVNRGDVSVNRRADGKVILGAGCIGSGCMAWRWTVEPARYRAKATGAIRVVTGQGYCGLTNRGMVE